MEHLAKKVLAGDVVEGSFTACGEDIGTALQRMEPPRNPEVKRMEPPKAATATGMEPT
jgi:hypothetical protein